MSHPFARCVRSGTLVPLLLPLLLTAGLAAGLAVAEERVEGGSVIRILPLLEPGDGRLEVQTLVLEPEVERVIFFLDGERVAEAVRPPFAARLRLATTAGPRSLRVEAWAGGRRLGEDRLEVVRERRPLRVRLQSIEPVAQGRWRVETEVSVPDTAQLESVELFLGERSVERRTSPPFDFAVEAPEPGPADYLRVVLRLADGRELEDSRLLAAQGIEERLDVRLVQLQVVVLDRQERPVLGLGPDDFRIVERGREVEVDRVFVAEDVSLLLGVALDSSGSMAPIWPLTSAAFSRFLELTLGPRDQAFVVDFDSRLRLLQEPTDEIERLRAALDAVDPEGGTALYDSVLYSFLQFERRPGRRGLVVITDGVDESSRSDPRRTIDLGRQLGVPVYVIALEGGQTAPSPPAVSGGRFGGTTPMRDRQASTQALRLLTDPTGGRLFRLPSLDRVDAALRQIGDELRGQYVVTYYSQAPPAPGETPEVTVEHPELGRLRLKVVHGAGQVD